MTEKNFYPSLFSFVMTEKSKSVMMDKKIRAIVVLAEFPKGENPFGAVDWDKVKKAGAELG